MGNFFAELRRRHIHRIGAGYVVVAWGVTQFIDVLSQVYALPAWIGQPVLALLAIGFPVTLIVAWLIERKAPETVASAVRSPAAAVDWLLFGALAVVIGLTGYQQLAPGVPEIALPTEPESVAVAAADEGLEEISDSLPNSVAVLPFVDLSTDPEHAFFAAGIHDTFLNELAKISAMNVISRSSVLRYADGQAPISQVAAGLNVETIMEGTVQYADGRVLVTAQLIDPETGSHLWSENYDREFEDIFAIQADIAMNIANALEAEFSVAELESIERRPTESTEAYLEYLKALAEIKDGEDIGGSRRKRTLAQSYLDRALQSDPEFALAHAWKAFIYSQSKIYGKVADEDWLDYRSEMDRLTQTHADRALALDPSVGLAHAALAHMHYTNWRGGQAGVEIEQALLLSPNDPQVLTLYSYIESYVRDRPEEALRYAQRALELDPNNNQVQDAWVVSLRVAGRYADAYEHLGRLGRPLFEIARGNHEAAVELLRSVEQQVSDGSSINIRARLIYTYGRLGRHEDALRAFEGFEQLIAARLVPPGDNPLDGDPYVDPITWASAYMGIGDYDEALNRVNVAAENREFIQSIRGAREISLNSRADPILEQPEWVEVRNKLVFRE